MCSSSTFPRQTRASRTTLTACGSAVSPVISSSSTLHRMTAAQDGTDLAAPCPGSLPGHERPRRRSRLPPRTASYEADPAQVHRVLLLYSGGLDTSVMLKWIQDNYDAEVVCLTVNLGQPGEDYDVIEGKALQLGALECHVVDAREEFAHDYVAAGDQGQRPLRRRLSAVHRARTAADRQARGRVRAARRLRHDRPRLHRQGQRPGAHRGHRRHARARAEDDRSRALLADGPRGGDRLRARARHPGQGRHRGGAVLDRRQPLGPLLGGPLDRGSRPCARRRRLPARHPRPSGARRARDGRGRVRARRARGARTASAWGWWS